MTKYTASRPTTTYISFEISLVSVLVLPILIYFIVLGVLPIFIEFGLSSQQKIYAFSVLWSITFTVFCFTTLTYLGILTFGKRVLKVQNSHIFNVVAMITGTLVAGTITLITIDVFTSTSASDYQPSMMLPVFIVAFTAFSGVGYFLGIFLTRLPRTTRILSLCFTSIFALSLVITLLALTQNI